MAILNIEELLNTPIGAVVKKEDNAAIKELEALKPTSRRVSRWIATTGDHKFVAGDTYVVSDLKKEISSFKMFIKKHFNLGVDAISKNGKCFCLIREIRKPVKKAKKRR